MHRCGFTFMSIKLTRSSTSQGTDGETVCADLRIIFLADVREVADQINDRIRKLTADDSKLEGASNSDEK